MLSNERKRSFGIVLAIVGMLLFSVGSHWGFLEENTDFNEYCCDSVKQMSHFFPALNDAYKNGDFFWSHEFGMGGDLFSSLSYYYTASPFFLVLLPFDISDFETFSEWRIWISIGKLFLMQLTLFFFLRSLNRSILSSFLSTIIYGGSTYFIFYSIRYDFMVDGMLWLPLLLWGFERYRKKGFSKLFILALFIVLSSNFYLAFMNSIFLGLYALMAYFLYEQDQSLKKWTLYMVKFFGQYALGFGLAAMFFIPAVQTFLQVDRFYYEIERPLFFTADYYSSLPFDVFTMEGFGLRMTLPLISILLIVLGFFIPNREARIRTLFHLMFLVMAALPFFYSFFNGMSSQQSRWMYMLLLSHVIMVPFVLDEVKKLSPRISLPIVAVCLAGVYLLYKQKEELIGIIVSDFDVVFLLLFAAGAVGILLVWKKWRISGMLLLITTVWYTSYQFQYTIIEKLLPEGLDYVEERQEEIKDRYNNPEIMSMLDDIKEKETAFHRLLWDTSPYENDSLLYHYNGFKSYNSLIAGNVHQFMKRDVNILHQNTPSIIDGLDDRLYLETLLTAHYKVEPTERLQEIPYGYNKAFQTENYTVLEQITPLPPAFTFKKAISKKVFDSLSYGKRDQLLLSAAVMEEPSIPTYDLETLRTDLLSIEPEDAIEMRNVGLNDDGYWTTIKPENGAFEFDNPFYGMEFGEVLVTISFKEKNFWIYTLSLNQKNIRNNGEKNIYNYPRDEFVFKIDTSHEKINLSFTPGQYDIQKIEAEYQPYEAYDRILQQQLTQASTNIEFDNNRLSMTVDPDGDEMLFVAVPYHKGWSAEVDGEKRDVQEIQSAFIGVPVYEWDEKVVLTYRTPGLIFGMVLGVISLLVIACIMYRRKKYSS